MKLSKLKLRRKKTKSNRKNVYFLLLFLDFNKLFGIIYK
jgi:hypothetical protein